MTAFTKENRFYTPYSMSDAIKIFWCWTFTQHTSFYSTSYVTDMNYITHRRFSVYFYQLIHWYLTRILTFLSEQPAPFSTMFASRAFHNVIWSQHSIFIKYTNEFSTCMKHIKLYIKLKVFSREIQICNLFGHTLFHWRVMALQSWTLQGILSKFLSTSKHWTRW